MFGTRKLVHLAPYQSYYDLLNSAAYHHDIAVNSTVKHHRAYTHLTNDDDDCAAGCINFEPYDSEDDICTYQAYHMNLLSLSPSHTSKVFIPKSIWNGLSNKVKELIIAHKKNVGSFCPHSPATSSPASHVTPISPKPVISCQVKVHEAEEPSETPGALKTFIKTLYSPWFITL